MGILFQASSYLDRQSLKKIYFTFIHCSVNYCHIAWANNTKTKLLGKQKHCVSLIYNKGKFSHSQVLLRDMNVLNAY